MWRQRQCWCDNSGSWMHSDAVCVSVQRPSGETFSLVTDHRTSATPQMPYDWSQVMLPIAHWPLNSQPPSPGLYPVLSGHRYKNNRGPAISSHYTSILDKSEEICIKKLTCERLSLFPCLVFLKKFINLTKHSSKWIYRPHNKFTDKAPITA